jgi:PKD repeat protein
MRKFTVVLFFVSFYVAKALAQTIIPCNTDEIQKQYREKYPEIVNNEQELKQYVDQWIKNNKDNASVRDGNKYIIPVVYHIIHDYGSENISDEQVRDDIRVMNLDYQKMNADTVNIIDEFKAIAAAPNVEFRLANKTPGGTCTNGIEHIHSLLTYAGNDYSKLNPWPRSMYLNIWTVKSIPGPPGGIIGAYATPPGSVSIPFLAPYDGVISRSDAIGTIGTADPIWYRTMPHEVGHIFNLNHTWTSVNGPIGVECGDDGVDDTPLTKGWFSVCPTPANAQVCTPGVIENYQNTMDYSTCKMMFTQGQVNVMLGAINAPVSERNNLWSEANLIATGTDDTIEPLCVPRVDFYSNYKTVCSGTSITFHDVSWGGAVDSREWNFSDGNPSTSTDKDPVVTFSTPGWKTVTLTVTNSAGNATEAREKYIYVSADQGMHPVGFFENFEDPNSFDNDYLVQNREGNDSYWQRLTGVGYYSSNCVYLNNYKNMVGDIDNLITPSYDISVGGPAYLNFRFSCASNATSSELINDVLKIYSSTDCGKTWTVRNTTQGIALANAGYSVNNFVPVSPAQWSQKSILLPAAVYDSNVRFRFEYTTNGNGNNIYIDDINLSAFPVGINDPDASSFTLHVFPNPVTDASVVSVYQKLGGKVNVKVVDQMGRIMNVLYSGFLSVGEHRFELSKSSLAASGLYYLVVDDGLTLSREKLVVQ